MTSPARSLETADASRPARRGEHGRGRWPASSGAQRQRPPRYSAKQVGGERSYRLARRGEAVELAEVDGTVHADRAGGLDAPELTFRAAVSAGTYLRAIARDLGERLGVGAHLTALRREAIGPLRVEDAVPLDRLSPATVIPARAVSGTPARVELDEPRRGRR